VDAGRPWQEFDRLLAQHGYDSRDLADVVAAFYLIAWEVSTAGDALAQPAGIAAVRGQARQMVAANPAMSRLDEAGRQATAETLAFYAMAMSARLADLRAAGVPQPISAFRAEVAQAVAQSGFLVAVGLDLDFLADRLSASSSSSSASSIASSPSTSSTSISSPSSLRGAARFFSFSSTGGGAAAARRRRGCSAGCSVPHFGQTAGARARS
jgi:hypothetical protein